MGIDQVTHNSPTEPSTTIVGNWKSRAMNVVARVWAHSDLIEIAQNDPPNSCLRGRLTDFAACGECARSVFPIDVMDYPLPVRQIGLSSGGENAAARKVISHASFLFQWALSELPTTRSQSHPRQLWETENLTQ
jgi:hypothetical protein